MIAGWVPIDHPSARSVRLRNLRAQVEAMEAFRDSMAVAMDGDEIEELARLMAPITDRILHELAELEHGENYVPHPHPHGTLERLWAELIEEGTSYD